MNILNTANSLEYFHGAVQVIEEDGSLLPCRFTDKQLIHYSDVDMYRIRSRCPSGIAFACKTSSSVINLTLSPGDYARSYMYFDLYIDGIFCRSFSVESEGKSILEIPLVDPRTMSPFEQECEVFLYFPHCRIIKLFSIDIENALPLERKNGTWLFLGDSITQGMDGSHPSLIYPVLCSRFLDMDMVDQAIGGHIFDVASLDYIGLQPEIISVAYGTNDWTRGYDAKTIEHNAREFLTELRGLYPASQICLVTPIWRAIQSERSKGGLLLEDVRNILSNLAVDFQAKSVDGLEMVPNESEYFVDGTHPNDQGFGCYALNLLKHISR